MYAVIFKAEIAELDDDYFRMAKRMQALAIDKYQCKEFVSVNEGKDELAISYWESKEHIQHWKQDAEHLAAQTLGRSKWYRSYTVQVVEVIREYCSGDAESAR